MLVSNKRSHLLTQTISFLSTCELLLLNIEKLILYNVLTECTSIQKTKPKFSILFNTWKS